MMANPNLASMGTGAGALYSSFGSNPADAAMDYTNQLESSIAPYYDPYRQAGSQSLNALMQQFMQLINNPAAVQQMLGSQFQASPGYDFAMQAGMNASNNAASAGGNLGSPAHTYNSQQTAMGIQNQEYDNFWDDMLSLYGMGLSGLQGINQMGYQANDAMGGYTAQNIMNQAMLAALGQMFENNQKTQQAGGIVSMGLGAVGL